MNKVELDTKYCHNCGTSKTASEFSKNRRRADGLQTQCKDCMAAYRDENREHLRALSRAHRSANLDLARERCREWHTTRSSEDPLWGRIRRRADTARGLGCEVEEFDSIDLELFWLCNGISTTRCYYTGELLGDPGNWELDHMKPLSRGGPHSVDNIVPCTKKVNREKRTKTPQEYAAYLTIH